MAAIEYLGILNESETKKLGKNASISFSHESMVNGKTIKYFECSREVDKTEPNTNILNKKITDDLEDYFESSKEDCLGEDYLGLDYKGPEWTA